MKLRGLELDQFRKFDRPVRLAGFGDRMNVLCGPNEFGKSTILAAIRGLLFERHNSKADPIKRMQNWRGNAAPFLAMDFETGGGLWRIEKRFMSQPMARLTGPGGARFDNDAAEEELQRLLGFGASGKTGAKPEHMGVWGALWVTQRDSVQQADLSSDLARSTITSCLDAEVGALTGTESGQALIRAVRDRRARLLDGNGKPKGRYKEVAAALDACIARLADLEARSQRLTDDATALRTATEKLARENDPAGEQRDQAALAEARRLKEAALLHAARLQSAQRAADLSLRAWQDAEREATQRQTRAKNLSDSAAKVAAEQQKLQRARTAEQQADAAYAESRKQAESALARQTAASAAARRARAVADLVGRAGALTVHQSVLAKADAEQAKSADLTARLEAMPVTLERLEAVRKSARELENARSLLEAHATRLRIDLEPHAAGKVTINGASLTTATAALNATDDTEINIAGIGSIRIIPAIQDREKITRRIDKAHDAFSGALLDAASTDLTEAETRYAERETLQRALADTRAALARLVPGDKHINLAPGIAALRDYVAVLERRLHEERATLALETLPTLEQAQTQAQAADEADIAAAEFLHQARAASDIAGDRRSEDRTTTATIEAGANAALADHARLESETSAAEAAESAAALAQRQHATREQHHSATAALAELQRAQPPETADFMQARIDRYEQALAQRQQTVRHLRETMAELRARIAQEGGHGLDEQIAAAKRERDALALERDTQLRETKILNLLLETLQTAERETKERYLAPVTSRVTPYLRSLFPGADIKCDETLRITGLSREQGTPEDFDRLSDGTQEQIAVLSRLAFAEMLIDQGKPAMVILDDALAYSDADRMERMFDILTQASAKTQILVLTCREDLFRRLGGNRIELTREPAPALPTGA